LAKLLQSLDVCTNIVDQLVSSYCVICPFQEWFHHQLRNDFEHVCIIWNHWSTSVAIL